MTMRIDSSITRILGKYGYFELAFYKEFEACIPGAVFIDSNLWNAVVSERGKEIRCNSSP